MQPDEFPITLAEFLREVAAPETRRAFGDAMRGEGKRLRAEWRRLLEGWLRKPAGES